MPLRGENDVFAVTFFRQGVDGIKNTLNAWDRERDRPRTNPGTTLPSSRPLIWLYCFPTAPIQTLPFLGSIGEGGLRRLGPFADGLGYSVDLGGYRRNQFKLGGHRS